MLTKREQSRQAVMAFIKAYIASNGGVAPSLDEIAAGIGQKSKGNIHRIVQSLVASGRLRKLDNRSRAMEVIHKPQRIEYWRWDDETKSFRRLFPLRKRAGQG